MKKYIISIESVGSPRINNLFSQQTFKQYQDDFKIFGIIGKNLTVHEYFTQGVAAKQKPMTPGELGCCLSHLEALRDFLSSDDQYALIFEDDVIERFVIDLAQLELEISALELPSNFFLSLGGIQMKICNRVRGYELQKKLFDQKVLKVDDSFLDNIAYAYAYIVDREMAEMLLEYHQPPRIYDHWQDLIHMEKLFNFYVTFLFEHPIIEQDNNLSYLEGERHLTNISVENKKNPLSYLRKKIKKYTLTKY